MPYFVAVRDMYENKEDWLTFVKHMLKNIIEQCREKVIVTFWDMKDTNIHAKQKYAYTNYAKYKIVNYEYICRENVNPNHYMGTYGIDKPHEFNDENLEDIKGLCEYIQDTFGRRSHIYIHLTCGNYLDSIKMNGLYGEDNRKKPVTFHQERTRIRSVVQVKSRNSKTRSRKSQSRSHIQRTKSHTRRRSRSR